MKSEYDVVIAGCGPAGSTTAETCAKAGLSVLVVEKRQEIGAPKRCGEGLSNNSVKQLGLELPERCVAERIDGAIAYAPNGETIKVQFEDTDGFILERKVFDKWLAEKAAEAGADIAVGVEVIDVKGQEVKIETADGIKKVKAKVVVGADGVESKVGRMVGLYGAKNPHLVDSGYQYEMVNINLKHLNKIVFYIGSEYAPRGYCWIFPKGKNRANVGIGINGDNEKTAKEYLDRFVNESDELRNGSILEVNAGCIPVGGLMKDMVKGNFLVVGDAANQVNPLHGGGIAESIKAGRIAGQVIAEAIDSEDMSILKKYNEIWWKERGEQLRKIEKVREFFERLTDEQMNDLVAVLKGEDLYDLVHGKKVAELAKVFLKWKMKGVARSFGER
jgi:digeranylgeranylglycerophospholipid reductase